MNHGVECNIDLFTVDAAVFDEKIISVHWVLAQWIVVWETEYILTDGAVLLPVTIHDFVVVRRLTTTSDVISTFLRFASEPNSCTFNLDNLSSELTSVQNEDAITCFIDRVTCTKLEHCMTYRGISTKRCWIINANGESKSTNFIFNACTHRH